MLAFLCKSVVAANVIVLASSTMAVALRVAVRNWKGMLLKGDDYTIILALILTLGLCAEGFFAAATNAFAEIATSEARRRESDKIYWIDVLVTHVIYGIVKISVLLFYRRIFTTKQFILKVNVTIGLVSGWIVAGFVTQLLCTTPINKMWQDDFVMKWNYDYGAFVFAMAILDITFDIFIIYLPMPVIRKLNMTRRKKLSLMGIFALGLFCIVATATRTYYIWKLNISLTRRVDIERLHSLASWTDIWSHIEAGASIVAACIPTLAPLLQFFHRCHRSVSQQDKSAARVIPQRPDRPYPWVSRSHSCCEATTAAGRPDLERQNGSGNHIMVQKSWGHHIEEE